MEDREHLLQINSSTDYVLGLFNTDHMEYNLLADNTTQPTLPEMVESALDILSKNENGYFLFILGMVIYVIHVKN